MAEVRQLLELVDCLGRLVRTEQRSRGAGLQPVHLQALVYLDRANRYSNTPQALAEYLGSTKGTVSQSLLLLYRRGLVERAADPGDRRVVRLALSARGRRLLRTAALERGWGAALGAIPRQRIAGAVETLERVLLELQRRRGGRSFGVCRSCRQFRVEAGGFRCGLTGEPLSAGDAEKICREHEPAA